MRKLADMLKEGERFSSLPSVAMVNELPCWARSRHSTGSFYVSATCFPGAQVQAAVPPGAGSMLTLADEPPLSTFKG